MCRPMRRPDPYGLVIPRASPVAGGKRRMRISTANYPHRSPLQRTWAATLFSASHASSEERPPRACGPWSLASPARTDGPARHLLLTSDGRARPRAVPSWRSPGICDRRKPRLVHQADLQIGQRALFHGIRFSPGLLRRQAPDASHYLQSQQHRRRDRPRRRIRFRRDDSILCRRWQKSPARRPGGSALGPCPSPAA